MKLALLVVALSSVLGIATLIPADCAPPPPPPCGNSDSYGICDELIDPVTCEFNCHCP